MMKLIIGVCMFALCGVAMAAKPTDLPVPQISSRQCDRTLPFLKVWADRQRFQVNSQGRSIDLRFVYRRRPPVIQPRKRVGFWQRNIWEIKGQIVEYKLDHGGIRIVLFWDARYMNVVIPAPICTKRQTRLRASIIRTWSFFVRRCGTPTPVYKPLGAVVYVRGVGFWANRHLFRRGMAPNGAELQPVTRLDIVAGCGT